MIGKKTSTQHGHGPFTRVPLTCFATNGGPGTQRKIPKSDKPMINGEREGAIWSDMGYRKKKNLHNRILDLVASCGWKLLIKLIQTYTKSKWTMNSFMSSKRFFTALGSGKQQPVYQSTTPAFIPPWGNKQMRNMELAINMVHPLGVQGCVTIFLSNTWAPKS